MEVKRYSIGPFDIYSGDSFERSLSDQIGFFQETPLMEIFVRIGNKEILHDNKLHYAVRDGRSHQIEI